MAVDTLQSLSEGDHVLFNDRKTPLTVTVVEEDRVFVDGPQGGEYVLFVAPDDPELVLVAKPGNRQYASKVEDLEVVGTWESVEDGVWQHSKTGATVQVVQNDAGYWTVDVDDMGGASPDVPGYGFLDREQAAETAEKFIANHPRGGT